MQHVNANEIALGGFSPWVLGTSFNVTHQGFERGRWLCYGDNFNTSERFRLLQTIVFINTIYSSSECSSFINSQLFFYRSMYCDTKVFVLIPFNVNRWFRRMLVILSKHLNKASLDLCLCIFSKRPQELGEWEVSMPFHFPHSICKSQYHPKAITHHAFPIK